jgi:phosphoglucosamine mutase
MASAHKYFGTDGIRGRVGEQPITPEFVLKLGWAVGKTFAKHGNSKVLIGKDTRISGYLLESALEAGLSAAGVDIYLLGPMPTPGIAYLTRTLHAQAGIVISASHNQYYDNGIKFFSRHGKKLSDEIEQAIEAQMELPMSTVSSDKLGRARRIHDAAGRYIEFCKSTVPFSTDLSGLRVIVDCANGATYHIAPNVVRELGAKVIGIADEPDGLNINSNCGSTSPGLLRATVLSHGADLGIALDGDGDRLVMVDSHGEILDGDDILYILSNDLLRRGQFRGGVVGTLMSNYGLEMALHNLSLPFARASVGDRYVLEELEKRSWKLGGEPSGHIVNLSNTTTGDGIVIALQVLSAMVESGQSLRDIRAGLVKLPQYVLNVPVYGDKNAVMCHENVQKAIKNVEQALAGRGRVLLRASGTESVVRVMVEGEDDHLVKEYTRTLADVVKMSC